jgi:DNA-nicking Smr family endonuclease
MRKPDSMTEIPGVDREDSELFRQAVGKVHPVRQESVPAYRRRPRAVPAQTRSDERAVMAALARGDFTHDGMETGEAIQFKRDGIQDRVFQKLRRGQFSIEAELDLHGLSITAAKEALSQFLANVIRKRQSCVRIIHGKGRGSRDGKPVLKLKLQSWLRQRNDVLAYCSARPRDGGTGAVYVLIKRQSPG